MKVFPPMNPNDVNPDDPTLIVINLPDGYHRAISSHNDTGDYVLRLLNGHRERGTDYDYQTVPMNEVEWIDEEVVQNNR